MAIEETTLLHFTVDQGAAEKQLEKVERLLLDNKAAAQELTKAYKAGTITQEEYVKENIRLQQNIAKEQSQKKVLLKTINTESNSRDALRLKIGQLGKEYDSINQKSAIGAKRADELQKELAQLNDQLNKGSKSAGFFKDNIGKYPETFGPAIQNIRVAGTSIGDLGTKLASFANPATAAVGIVGALGAAYAKSALGAKDLEFAQNQVTTAFTLSSNALAEFISGTEDGEGIVSSFVNELISRFGGASFAAITRFGANLTEQLEDLGRLEAEIRINANQRIEENQELLEKISDDQTKINDKLIAADVIEKNLEINKRNILDVLNSQLRNLESQEKLHKNDDRFTDLRIAKQQEISKESAALEKQLLRIRKQQTDITNEIASQVRLTQELFEFDVREANAPPVSLAPQEFDFASGIDDPAIEASKARQTQFISELKTVQQTEDQKRQAAKQTSDFRKAEDQAQLQSAEIVFNALSGLAKEGSAEQRALALVAIGLDTAQALTGGIAAAQDVPYPGNLVAMASVIATILANVAAAKQYIEGFEEGGFTGPGRDNQAKGIVHANEYVTPAHVVRSPAAQPHLHALESMRMRGYQDGGFVTNQSTAPVQQALIMANALKNLPRPILDVRQVTSAQQQIDVKQAVSTLGR